MASSIGQRTHRSPITFACISDTHGLHASRPDVLHVPPADVLLFAGDAGLETDREVRSFNTWLMSLPVSHRVVTFGNMDTWGEDHPEGDPGILPAAMVVVDKVVEVAGWRLLASPWTPVFEGVFQLHSEEAAVKHWSRLLPPDTLVDVLVTHGPPHGYGDATRGRHVGDRALLKAVQALAVPPLLWVCGHIHASWGQHVVPHPRGDITLINAASYYLAEGETEAAPLLVELPSRRVSRPPAAAAAGALPATAAPQRTVWRAPEDFVL